MENKNVDPEVGIDKGEDIIPGKVIGDPKDENPEETITVPKAKFTSMQRKAIAYDANKEKPAPLPTREEPVDEGLKKDVESLKSAEQKRQFGYAHGLSPEETDKVFQISGGKPTDETLKDPFVIAGLEALRAAKRVAANTPGSSSGAKLYGGKPFNELSKADKQKAWEDEMKGVKI